ncbi:hypothetical protein [uncultured Ramlibacter sp.]|uniref:hypothetical protein n=1 Tax=uncultured Ramlibacter sp. TaxID=260755 RepID=UPI0026056CB0|nr:hypothetical protein [uncultured Ramlibacter sp.]
MPLRWILFALLASCHAAVLVFQPQAFAPAGAGTVYLPLMAFHTAGVPVFATAQSGGWAAPSLLGWVVVGCLWAAIWWGVAVMVARLLARR